MIQIPKDCELGLLSISLSVQMYINKKIMNNETTVKLVYNSHQWGQNK